MNYWQTAQLKRSEVKSNMDWICTEHAEALWGWWKLPLQENDEYEFHAFPIHVIHVPSFAKKTFNWGCSEGKRCPAYKYGSNKTWQHPASWSFQTLRMLLLDTHEFTQLASNKAGRMVLLGIFPNKQLPNGVPACVVEGWKLSRNRRPVQLRHHFSLQV